MSGQQLGGEAPERPGRYERSPHGLLAALLVVVLAVGAFVAFRAAFRDTPQIEPEPVDYRETVAAAQDAGARVTYPRVLPDGWIATNAVLEPGTPPEAEPAFEMAMLTDDGRFVGLREEHAPVEDLLAEYVDPDTDPEPGLQAPGAVARSWDGWSDAGGDLAYSAQVGRDTLLVFGSADADDLRRLIDALTTRPLDDG